jgi:hypothetical protein
MKILWWAASRYFKRNYFTKLVTNQKLTFELLKRIGHVRRIQKRWRIYWTKKLLKDIYSVKLQSIYRMKRVKIPLEFYTKDLTLALS